MIASLSAARSTRRAAPQLDCGLGVPPEYSLPKPLRGDARARRPSHVLCGVALVLTLAMIACSTTRAATATTATTSMTSDQPTVLIVLGAEGTPEYGGDFSKWANRWRDAAQRGSARVVTVGRDTAPSDQADKQRLKDLLDAEAELPASQPLWLVFIGHGRSDALAMKSAVRVAKAAAEAKVLDAMKSAIEESLKK